MNKWIVIIMLLCLMIPGSKILFSDAPPEEVENGWHPPTERKKGWVYGQIEYQHDILAPNEYFLKLHDHPSDNLGVPEVYGGYATTDVYAKVKLRGIAVPRALQEVESRARPPLYLDRERRRWDEAMQYVWNVMQPTKTFRVGNMEILEEDKLLEADIEVQLGGQWLPLAVLMVNDHFAAAEQNVTWDFGAKELAPQNPNVPR